MKFVRVHDDKDTVLRPLPLAIVIEPIRTNTEITRPGGARVRVDSEATGEIGGPPVAPTRTLRTRMGDWRRGSPVSDATVTGGGCAGSLRELARRERRRVAGGQGKLRLQVEILCSVEGMSESAGRLRGRRGLLRRRRSLHLLLLVVSLERVYGSAETQDLQEII